MDPKPVKMTRGYGIYHKYKKHMKNMYSVTEALKQ
jgi:hypothetical protein